MIGAAAAGMLAGLAAVGSASAAYARAWPGRPVAASAGPQRLRGTGCRWRRGR
jgi:hypothetical protein